MEFINKNLEDRANKLFEQLVPPFGQCETVEGEMLRAAIRLVHRYYNDGDRFFLNYGVDACGGAHAYLMQGPLKEQVKPIFEKMFGVASNYERGLNNILKVVVEYVESREGRFHKNSVDVAVRAAV